MGAVFHAVQDITQPFHTWGVSANGHVAYEDWISNHLDPTSAWVKNPDEPEEKLVWDLHDPEIEKEYLFLVSKENCVLRSFSRAKA